jgi:hypothetical protein
MLVMTNPEQPTFAGALRGSILMRLAFLLPAIVSTLAAPAAEISQSKPLDLTELPL